MPAKLDADAFLYLSPEPNTPDFAQCSSCRDWIKDDDLCRIHGPYLEVLGSMSCGLYVYGEPLAEEAYVIDLIMPDESGLVDREVRCENCRHFEAPSLCGLFKYLNDKLPDTFEIDTEVEPKGCCNAQQPREREA
jgi:hypothetical protein